jgi:hypothetical protein
MASTREDIARSINHITNATISKTGHTSVTTDRTQVIDSIVGDTTTEIAKAIFRLNADTAGRRRIKHTMAFRQTVHSSWRISRP